MQVDLSEIELFIVNAWPDYALKAALISNPAVVLKAQGIIVPVGVALTVLDGPGGLPVLEIDYADADVGKLIAKAWREPSFKAALIADPVAVAQAEGIDVPADLTFTVLENTDKHFHLILPAAPSDGLSDETLESLAVATPSAKMYPLRRHEVGKLMAKAWRDQAFKAALFASPVAAIQAEGIVVPEGMTLTLAENTNNHVHLILPPAPTGVLSDEELELVVVSKSFLPFL